MGINVIERTRSDCKYVEICTHYAGSIGALIRRTVFIRETNTNNNNNNNNNKSVKIFIIYVPSQQLQGQWRTQHSLDAHNYIKDKHNIKTTTNYRKAMEEENTLIEKNKQTN
jgi:hypothetical protein